MLFINTFNVKFQFSMTFKLKTKQRLSRLFSIPLYNLTYSSQHNYAWFRIAKNGTRTFLNALETNNLIENSGNNIPYLSYRFKNHFKFCFIRNPWDRLVSCYSNKVVNKQAFRECWDKDFDFFIRYISKQNLKYSNKHFRPQIHLFPVTDVNFIGKMENYSDDLNKVMEQLNIDFQIQHLNKSKHKHYTEYYSNENREIVEKLYKDDIDLGNYRFGE